MRKLGPYHVSPAVLYIAAFVYSYGAFSFSSSLEDVSKYDDIDDVDAESSPVFSSLLMTLRHSSASDSSHTANEEICDRSHRPARALGTMPYPPWCR